MNELIPGYSFREMTRDDLSPFFERYRQVIFVENQHLDAHYAHSETEQAAISTLAENLLNRFGLRPLSRRHLRRLALGATGDGRQV